MKSLDALKKKGLAWSLKQMLIFNNICGIPAHDAVRLIFVFKCYVTDGWRNILNCINRIDQEVDWMTRSFYRRCRRISIFFITFALLVSNYSCLQKNGIGSSMFINSLSLDAIAVVSHKLQKTYIINIILFHFFYVSKSTYGLVYPLGS